jgi:hypothetical protein
MSARLLSGVLFFFRRASAAPVNVPGTSYLGVPTRMLLLGAATICSSFRSFHNHSFQSSCPIQEGICLRCVLRPHAYAEPIAADRAGGLCLGRPGDVVRRCQTGPGSAQRQGFGDSGFRAQVRLACSACHTAWPELNNFGQVFRDNGYQLMNDRDSPIWQNPSYFPISVSGLLPTGIVNRLTIRSSTRLMDALAPAPRIRASASPVR